MQWNLPQLPKSDWFPSSQTILYAGHIYLSSLRLVFNSFQKSREKCVRIRFSCACSLLCFKCQEIYAWYSGLIWNVSDWKCCMSDWSYTGLHKEFPSLTIYRWKYFKYHFNSFDLHETNSIHEEFIFVYTVTHNLSGSLSDYVWIGPEVCALNVHVLFYSVLVHFVTRVQFISPLQGCSKKCNIYLLLLF